MSHTAKALILQCMDFRFEEAIDEFIDTNQYTDNVDIISLAGAAKTLADPADEGERHTVLNQIGLSKKLHNVRDVVLLNHTDCGAYGGRRAFASDDAEYERHVQDLKLAQDMLRQFYPGVNVRIVLAKIELQKKITFEEVNSF